MRSLKIEICYLKTVDLLKGNILMYKRFIKRLMDIILSLIAIVVLALPMLLIVMAIKFSDPGPVMFKQRRVGMKKDGKITYFMIWKFRSMKMSTPSDVPTHLLENPDQYITKVGKVLRKLSLDELPQIFQVLTSQLSFVGPRPALWSLLKLQQLNMQVSTVKMLSM